MTLALTNTLVGPVTCDALRLLPEHIIIKITGQHVLAQIAEDWYCLVGPDDESTAIETAVSRLPGTGWTVTFESFGDALLTHFER
jgi:hypothetical protein